MQNHSWPWHSISLLVAFFCGSEPLDAQGAPKRSLQCLVIALAQVTPPPNPPPLPPRAYQPTLIDPGLDGEKPGGARNCDLTPDGKVLIGYRRTQVPNPDGSPDTPGLQMALIAAVVRPERMLTNAYGYLTGFYQLSGTTAQDFTFGLLDVDDPPPFPAPEQAVIHPIWVPSASNACDQDANYPIGTNAHISIALKPLAGGNPYRSDASGNPHNAGAYSCYKIWVLSTHAEGFKAHIDCAPLEPLRVVHPDPNHPLDPMLQFVCQDVTVVIDEAARSVVHTSLDSLPFEFIQYEDPPGQPLQRVMGLEPSVTADGRLILYHGNGSDPNFHQGDGNVTYLYNPIGCQATGWTAPRTITQLPTFTDITGGPTAAEQTAQFKLRYRLFAQPIRMLPISNKGPAYPYDAANGYVFKDGISQPADNVRGLYLWVSKDGSFYLATCAGATEASEALLPEPGPRTRAGGYICGDITGGYVKHIDDVGINPTRRGGDWHWPSRGGAPSERESWRTMTFSTGLKPGLWEPLLGEGAPLPTQIASARIPILPLFETETSSYGEIRCEELDGNYLLYLACNESLMLADQVADYEIPKGRTNLPGECDVIFDLSSTPDTSGRPTRARCTLNSGAAFPQEVMGSSMALRTGIGAALGPGLGLPDAVKLHECVGFRGQAIVFNGTGHVVAAGAPGLGGLQRCSVQAFVKVVGTPTGTVSLVEYNGLQGSTVDTAFSLTLDPQGRFTATISTTNGDQAVQSRILALPFAQSMFDSRTGWRHVAATFDGNSSGQSRLRLYLDGLLETTSTATSTSAVRLPTGVRYYKLGPGSSTSSDPVDDGDKLLILDEVAVSNVARSVGELRRDAYVPALADGFGPWPPSAPSLPMALDPAEARWPDGVTYDPDVVTLGRDLFDDFILSASGTGKCSLCHIRAEHFADQGQPVVPGVLNVPTLINAAFGAHKLFDGSAASLENQVWRPITGTELGPQTVADVLARINSSAFASRFTDPGTFGAPASQTNVAQAIAMYERTLNSGGSAWDSQSLNQDQRDGAGLFFGKARCFACHRGTSFTDDDFHNVLTVKTSEGKNFRGDFTGRANENGRVKTPTLRNVQHTAPYFHDGSKATLHDVILHYNSPPFGATDRVGKADIDLRPLELTSDEMNDMEAFLGALSGTIP